MKTKVPLSISLENLDSPSSSIIFLKHLTLSINIGGGMGVLCQMILTCILTVKFTKGRKDLPFRHSSATDSSTIYSSASASLAADSSTSENWNLI